MGDVKLLVVTPTYPHSANPMAGIFNERSAEALAAVCSHVEVLAPRPLVPPGLRNRNARWKSYSRIPELERRNGINVYRPGYIQIPGPGASFWSERMAYAMGRRLARRLHAAASFDAILSFDLLGGGSIAWRLGRDLGLFTAGWATGGDVRVAHQRGARRVVRRTLQKLDLVFYQSSELMAVAAELQGKTAATLDLRRNMVLPRGIPAPPLLERGACRARWRSAWNVSDREVLVMYIGRITRPKGAYELLAAAERTASSSPLVRYVVIGAREGFDESAEFSRRRTEIAALRGKFLVLPACAPSDVWSYLCAADIAAFPSHAEGMPNGLLEALAMELPAVTFRIPAIRDIDPRSEFLLAVPPLDADRFADALESLARAPEERRSRGRRGSERVSSEFQITRNMSRAVDRITDRLGPRSVGPTRQGLRSGKR
jgi:teichuronic acid biosynthesis glycosyltransferase TuaC